MTVIDSGAVLVLGAGKYQLPMIEAIHRRNLRCVAFDGDANAPGLTVADEGRVIDISDPARVLEAARAVRPAAVVTIVAEVAVRTAAQVTTALGLPGLSPEVALAATDKFVMREQFQAAGLPCPKFRRLESQDDVALAAEVGFPLVVKPTDSSGSRGVRRVDKPDELPDAIANALRHSRSRQAIAESFVEGVECTVETFSSNGHVEILGISDKVHIPFPHCVSISLTYPPYFDSGIQAQIANAAKQAIQAVGLRDGTAHIEILMTRDGPVLVELAARGGGYRIFSDILREISGVDPVDAVLDVALGRAPAIEPTRSRAAVLRFFNPPGSGILRAIHGLENARRLPGVFALAIEAELGQEFHGITRDGERPGYTIVTGDTREDAIAVADQVERLVRFDFDAVATRHQPTMNARTS
jgi:biotin carboxylase